MKIHIFYCARRVDALALGLQISGSEFRGLVGPGPLWGRTPQPAMESVDPSKMMPNSTSSSEPQALTLHWTLGINKDDLHETWGFHHDVTLYDLNILFKSRIWISSEGWN